MKYVKKFEGVFEDIPDDYTVDSVIDYLEEYWSLDPDEFIVDDNHIKDVFFTELTLSPRGRTKLSVCLSVAEIYIIVTLYINETVYEQDRCEGAGNIMQLFDEQINPILKMYNADFDYVQRLNQENIKMKEEIETNEKSIVERVQSIKMDRNMDQYRTDKKYPNRMV